MLVKVSSGISVPINTSILMMLEHQLGRELGSTFPHSPLLALKNILLLLSTHAAKGKTDTNKKSNKEHQ